MIPAGEKVRLEILRKEISVGLGQLEQGDVTDHDDQSLTTLAADLKAQGRRCLAARENSQA